MYKGRSSENSLRNSSTAGWHRDCWWLMKRMLGFRWLLCCWLVCVSGLFVYVVVVLWATDPSPSSKPQQQHRSVGDSDPSYVLVRGFPKSGTSWVRMLLSLHPAVYMLPYEAQFQRVFDAVSKAQEPPWLGSREPYRSLIQDWAAELMPRVLNRAALEHPDARWVGEKSPVPLAPLLPGGRYVLVVRDGRDVLVSLLWHHVRVGGFDGFCHSTTTESTGHKVPVAVVDPELTAEWRSWHRASQDKSVPPSAVHQLLPRLERDPTLLTTSRLDCVRQLAAQWAAHMLADARTLLSLGNGASDRVILVRYSSVAADVETERTRLYRWLGLSEQLAEPLGQYTSPLADLADDSPLRPPKDNLFFRKGRPGDWKQHFTPESLDVFNQAANVQAAQSFINSI